MDLPLISIIIPVYNAEQYLQRCLDSIINQTYRNLEIICIDDGSTDSSGAICDDNRSKDSRIRVVHQTNKGLSAARNKGLDIARGEYIAFIDSDDYVEREMYEKMLQAALLHHVDVCVCQWQYEFADGRQVVDTKKIDPSIYGCKSSTEFTQFLYRGSYENGVVVSAWNKLYCSQVLRNARFKGLIHEDDAFSNQIFSKEHRVFVMKDQFYIYTQNQTSLTNKPFSPDKFFFLDVLIARHDLFKTNAFICHETERLYCNMYIEYCICANKAHIAIPLSKKYRNTFRQMYLTLCRQEKTSIKFRIRMRLFYFSPALYKIVTKQ